ncbi:phosphopyruvate hydratase [Saguinus oedipus]|uniref:phosphopyruvate hydratase n=1 Tax=Saguinus oedipus TaxID=9490 RepID=A0ABQ9TTD3_SAGOE|nr:phosphopyruvate hydratase [Saguinus oedipus]
MPGRCLTHGNPTVEVSLFTTEVLFRAAVLSGVSTGNYEALELQDNDKTCYMGKGVSKAIEHISKTIVPALVSKKLNITEQEKIDKLMIQMEGTENKSMFGVNAILRVSLAMCKAGAVKKGVPLYRHIASLAANSEAILSVLVLNVINGGSQAGNKLAMQEFMNLLVGATNLRGATRIGDEAGYTDKVIITMDIAASKFNRFRKYDLDFKSSDDSSRYISSDKLNDLHKSFVNDYPVVSIENPFDQND